MKRKSLVQRALEEVPGFPQSYNKFCNTLLIEQKSKQTIENYSRYFADICLANNSLAEDLTNDQIESYLANKLQMGCSRSLFMHIVCGLRSYFRSLDLEKQALRLPKIKRVKSLPVVLNYEECKRLFRAPSSQKHRFLLAFIYSAGLRSNELIHLRLQDIDIERKTIHIRKAKYNKDRYVPLAECIIARLDNYLQHYKPQEFLFNGASPGKPIASHTIQFIMREAVKKAGILKRACPHTLRHSYATHMLEMGTNIRQLMELLGHSDINSTLVYLHLINENWEKAFSPLDRLYNYTHGKA